MKLYGHPFIQQTLSQEQPQVSLFLGPESVGKWTFAEAYRQWLGGAPELLRGKMITKDDAEAFQRFVTTPPYDGDRKMAILHLDGASESTVNRILPTLEELPPSSYVVLIATKWPLPTITSRAVVHTFGYLTPSQVERILIEKKNFSEADAKEASKNAATVQEALDAFSPYGGEELDHTKQLLRALIDRDLEALFKAANTWQDEDTELLHQWSTEAYTKQWRRFKETTVTGWSPDLPIRLLMAIRPNVRAKLLIRSRVAALIKEES